MGRAPCCEKMGLKKGPWTPEEDQILVAHTQRYGHGNWRALPKQAGLLRCGKSCRLRWTNYLRPDIKRGNFTREEEETIISLHEMLGNRWSAIAARLPGRTDNEIKNVWHTHLKKRVSPNPAQESRRKPRAEPGSKSDPEPNHDSAQSPSYSVVTVDGTNGSSSGTKEECMDDSLQGFPEIDESFWSDALSMNATSSFKDPFGSTSSSSNNGNGDGDGDGDEMSFWLKVFMESGDSLELPDI